MIWNTICRKINHLFLLSLIKAVTLIVHFFLKDAEIFLQRYPLLNTDPASAWHSFGLTLSDIVAYGLSKRPMFIKLALLFSLLISFGVFGLGGLMAFNQAQTLQNQMLQFNKLLATQTAFSLKTPLLLNNPSEMTAIVSNITTGTMIAGVTLYGNDYSVIKSYGINHNSAFPVQEVEYQPESAAVTKIIGNMLGKIRRVSRYTIPIKHDDLLLGYLSLSFDYSDLETVRVETLQALIVVIIVSLMVSIMMAFYISGLLFKPLNDFLTASELAHQINLGEDKHDPNSKYTRKDELQMLMEEMNKMTGGLLEINKIKPSLSHYASPQVADQLSKELEHLENVKLGGEHVMASVFFADIVGFTSLSESMEPKEISELLNVYFSKIIKAVNFCNGHVDKFIGDCAMVLFGVPEKNPQHAFNCIACGWMILQLIEQLNDKREADGEVTVEFRIGANSGMMLAGNMGSAERMEYTVVGDSVNLASRLSGTGEPSELIITEDVFIEQGLEGSVLTEVKDLIKLRGKKLPVKILNVKDILTPFKEQMLNEIPLIIEAKTK